MKATAFTFTQLLSSVLQCCFTSTETIKTIRNGVPRMATSTFTQLRSSVLQCCFTSTETIKTIRNGEPRTSTSTFSQLLGSDGGRSGLPVPNSPHRRCGCKAKQH